MMCEKMAHSAMCHTDVGPIQRSHHFFLENDTVRDISNKGDLMVFPC